MTKAKSQDAIAEAIEDLILEGKFLPGAKLDEQALASQFDVSRTPIREALNRLSATGMVVARPHHGMFVAKMSVTKLIEMSEVMAELEAMCARLAAKRMTSAERRSLAKLAEMTASGSESDKPEAYTKKNFTFHRAIYEGSHNSYLVDWTTQVRRRLAPYRRFALEMPGRMVDSAAEHQAITEAIVDGNAEDAATLMRRHVDIRRAEFADLLLVVSDNLPDTGRVSEEAETPAPSKSARKSRRTEAI